MLAEKLTTHSNKGYSSCITEVHLYSMNRAEGFPLINTNSVKIIQNKNNVFLFYRAANIHKFEKCSNLLKVMD